MSAYGPPDPTPPGALPYADITNPQSLNKYAYTYNNPLRYVDPTGHEGEDETQRSERAAMSYSEKTNGTVEEHEAMQSTVMNRVSSGDKQWVGKGQELNEHNVVHAKNQYQGVGGPNYDAYMKGDAKDKGAQNAAKADANLQKSGKPSTDATSFVVNPGGKAPTATQTGALGRVEPAKPAKAGDVYLYKPKPPEQKPKLPGPTKPTS